MRHIVTVAALAALAGCGQAQAATRSFQVTDFARLRVEGPFDVRVRTGVPSGARATGSQAAIDRVAVEQRGETLVVRPIRSSGGWSWNKDDKLVIEIGARSLAGATLIGSGEVAIDRVRGDGFEAALSGSGDLKIDDAQVRTLKATLTGSGDLTIAGRGDFAQATVTGSGDLHGDAFAADRAEVNLVGSGDLALGARRTAKVTLGGSGDVTIVGDAQCTVAKTGSGDVKCAHGGGGD